MEDAASTVASKQERSAFTTIPKRLIVVEDVEEQDKKIGRTQSNHVLMFRNCHKSTFTFQQNQRLSMVMAVNCTSCRFILMDSVVVTSRTCRVLDCHNCEFVFEDMDCRKVECWRTTKSNMTYIGEAPLVDNARVIWREGCYDNEVRLADLEHSDDSWTIHYSSLRSSPVPRAPGKRSQGQLPRSNEKDKEKDKEEEVHLNGHMLSFFDESCHLHHVPLLQEEEEDDEEEGKERKQQLYAEEARQHLEYLSGFISAVLPGDDVFNSLQHVPTAEQVLAAAKELEDTPFKLSREELDRAYDDERQEWEEEMENVRKKARGVAAAILEAKHVVIYTGAGVSTSANIPDFRGPQGVWTLQAKGQLSSLMFAAAKKDDGIKGAQPTYTHYAITELARRGLVRCVISTNMDGLHLRSGLPPHLLVEQHGNSFNEICERCGREHYRYFDVMQTVVHSRQHYTGRLCSFCGGRLQDTIVHFSESFRARATRPLSNYHARTCDLALVMGTSMNVQPSACYPDKCLRNPGGKLMIVNLQATPFDSLASIRVFARTDAFMAVLMEELGLQQFDMTPAWYPAPLPSLKAIQGRSWPEESPIYQPSRALTYTADGSSGEPLPSSEHYASIALTLCQLF
ncbi:NAD-dependent protein deacetylase sirtuin-7 [Balamuthia mandrillaris]